MSVNASESITFFSLLFFFVPFVSLRAFVVNPFWGGVAGSVCLCGSVVNGEERRGSEGA